MTARQVIIFFTIIIIELAGGKVYAQTNIERQQNLVDTVMNNDKTDESKIENEFKVDNNIYKLLDLNNKDNEVMLLEYSQLNDSKSIIVKNNVDYNGQNYKVKYIYEKAFNNCNNENNIIFDADIAGFCDSIGNLVESLNNTFMNNEKLESVDFGNCKITFGEKCFKNCANLKNINLSRTTKFNGGSVFENCLKLRDIQEFNDELIKLPDKMFKGCNNLKINSLKNVTKLGDECFASCKEIDSDIVTNVKEIGMRCFFNCSFKEVNLSKAEKIGINAFGDSKSLTKITFGSPLIPDIEERFTNGSPINEFIYPLDYKNQQGYLKFLNRLRVSKIIWNSNYGDFTEKSTNENSLNSLDPPPFTREGYELEGWYKEPECINKVSMIADLAITIGSNLVIKDPKLYAKWVCKEENNGGSHQQSDPKDPNKDSGEIIPSNNPKESDGNTNKEKGTSDSKEQEDNANKDTNLNDGKETADNTNKETNSKDRGNDAGEENTSGNQKASKDNLEKEKNSRDSTKTKKDIDINTSNESNNSRRKKRRNKHSISNNKENLNYSILIEPIKDDIGVCLKICNNYGDGVILRINTNSITISSNINSDNKKFQQLRI